MNQRCKGCSELVATNHEYCGECTLVKIDSGFTRAELTDAFNTVANKTNWKNAINAAIPRDVWQPREKLLCAAIIFFTGSVPRFGYTTSNLLVFADGYYAAIGA